MAIENNGGKGQKTKISIVIPALNEEQGIRKTIQAIPKSELEDMGYDVQILVVDNGSTDRTSEVVKEAGAEVVFEPRRGYGRAYKTGFANAKGEIIVTADADSSYPVEDITRLAGLLEDEDLDFITTDRLSNTNGDGMSSFHRAGNRFLSFITRFLFGINIKDSQSGMWAFRKNILDKLLIRSNGMSFSEELKIEACYYAKCSWKELPICYKARVGKVKLRPLQDSFENLFYLIRKRFCR